MGDLQRIKPIFGEALEREGTDRRSYLDEACGQDTALRQNVESLLRAHEGSMGFLESPILEAQIDVEDPPVSEAPGTVIGRYRLLERIGEGGMAVVYMAEQESPIQRKVALKIIKLGMDTKQVIARFEAERQALAMMDHPHIAKVFDAGATETGRPYFVMELVNGVSITEYCDTNCLTTTERLALFIQVCSAVQHAHQKGIIHRDIKPSNVMVTMHNGVPAPKVIDFGIAKATNQKLTERTLFTRYAHIVGTPVYMSPEQAELSDLDIDTRSDIYSLGVLLYELLTGATPFAEEDLRKAGYLEMQRIIREEEPTKPSTKLDTLGASLTDIAKFRCVAPEFLKRTIRGDLDWIVMKSLEKDRTRRYETVNILLEDVNRYLDHAPVLASPPSIRYRARKFFRRHLTLVTSTVVVILAVLLGLIGSTALYIRAERARRREVMAHAETQAVTSFLTHDLLASVHPERVKGKEMTVRYLLDAATENLEAKLAKNPLAEARVRGALGLAYRKMGEYSAAEPHLEQALEIRLRELGNEHLATLASLHQLGQLRWYQGRTEEAEPLLREAFEARLRLLGLEHPDTLESMVNLSWLETGRSSRHDKMALAETAYETAKRVLGPEHPITLEAASGLATRYVESMRAEKAEALAFPTYELSRDVLGPEHETTLVLMTNIAWLHYRYHRYEAGIAIGKQAVETSRHVFGEAHPVTLYAMSGLGQLYAGQGSDDKAISLLVRAVDLGKTHLGEDHTGTLCCKLRLALVYKKQGRYDNCDMLLIDVLLRSRRYGEDSITGGYARYNLLERSNQLAAWIEELKASGDRDGAAAAETRLEEIQRALKGDSQRLKDGRD